MEQNPVIECRISVRELVGFVLKSGSIDNRFGGRLNRMQEGARIHRFLQKQEGDCYQPEVPLNFTCDYQGVRFLVEGRADGIITREEGVTVDEIKTTGVSMEMVTESFQEPHWAQAQCYGYFICVQRNLDSITIRLTYYQTETEEIKRFTRIFSRDSLRQFYEGLLERYVEWAVWQAEWRQIRNCSIRMLRFPFASYRKGQREMAAAVYRTISSQSRLYCQAPTGIGKTISALFPAVKAIGEGKTETIFYLTAKTVARRAAEDALSQLREQGLRIKSVTLTAKEKICFLEECACNPDQCPYAQGYFDRINGVLKRLLEQEDFVTREKLEAYAKQEKICPFELALDYSEWCDVVIGDYNHLFDPNASLKRFFSNTQGEYSFLIDESHNLVDRAREMYSASLEKSMFLKLKKELGKENKELARSINRIYKGFLALGKSCEEAGISIQKEGVNSFNRQLWEFSACCEEWLSQEPDSTLRQELLSIYFDVLFYLRIADFYDERYVTYIEKERGEVRVKQLCLDPSFLLKQALDRGKSAILFSATLTPLDYFRSVLGGDEKSKTYSLPSPYDPAHLCLLVEDGINTRYQYRQKSILPICQLIHSVIGGKTGNYLVFFPSYQYLRQVYEVFTEHYPSIQTIVQESQMEEEKRGEFLSCFDKPGRETLVGFCVLGGIFSEGIDLKGERLVGAVIVGVGLPQINRQQEILREYYDKKEKGKGFSFVYRYPGMNKVMQAAGRVIRGEKDRGVVVLIDDRFHTKEYLRLFPVHWQKARFLHNIDQAEQVIKDFWKEEK